MAPPTTSPAPTSGYMREAASNEWLIPFHRFRNAVVTFKAARDAVGREKAMFREILTYPDMNPETVQIYLKEGEETRMYALKLKDEVSKEKNAFLQWIWTEHCREDVTEERKLQIKEEYQSIADLLKVWGVD